MSCALCSQLAIVPGCGGGGGEVQLKVGQRRVTAPHATRVTGAAAGAMLGRNHEAVRSKFQVVKFSILRLTLCLRLARWTRFPLCGVQGGCLCSVETITGPDSRHHIIHYTASTPAQPATYTHSDRLDTWYHYLR